MTGFLNIKKVALKIYERKIHINKIRKTYLDYYHSFSFSCLWMTKKIRSRSLKYFLAGLIIGFFFHNQFFNKLIFKKENKNNNFLHGIDNKIKTKCNYSTKGPRILCAIFTYKDAHSKIHNVHNTWGKR